MRILHFYKAAMPDSMGGVEQVIHEIASGAGRHGIATDVVALTNQDKDRVLSMDGYTVYLCRKDFEIASSGFSWRAALCFKKLLHNASLVHYHFPWPYMDMVHFLTGNKKPAILTYHSDIIKQKYLAHAYRPLMSKFLESVHHIVATSPNYLKSSPILQKYKNKVSVIPLGIDGNLLLKLNDKKRQLLHSIVGEDFFLFIGVLRYYKGLHILLEACANINAKIVIAGAGPEETALKKRAAEMGLKNVVFLGRIDDEEKAVLLDLCLAMVFPSHLRSEAFGVSLIEASMFGKPMISCEIGTGTSFVNINGTTGTVVPPENSSALRSAMYRMISDPSAAKLMGKNARSRYLQELTSRKMITSYIDLYKNATGISR